MAINSHRHWLRDPIVLLALAAGLIAFVVGTRSRSSGPPGTQVPRIPSRNASMLAALRMRGISSRACQCDRPSPPARPGGERRGEEADRDAGDERPPVHHSIT